MNDANPAAVGFDPRKVLESVDPAQVSAALSKLVAASIGDMVVVLSRSPAHKHYSLADIEWMVLPPVTTGQFYVAEVVDKERGFRTPIAVVTWAFVSEDLDASLQEQERPSRLRPDQWTCGSIGWLVDAVGTVTGVRAALEWLAQGPFREQPLKMIAPRTGSAATVTTLEALMAGTNAAEVASDVR